LRTHQVIVNDTPCKYSEPPSEKSLRFRSPREIANLLGSATCVLKISSEPLLREENVIAVLCNGYLHATTLAGKQSEPFVEYIFGEVEAPMLDRDTGPLPPFDNTRNLALNPQNPRVQALNTWLADCIDQVLQELIERDRRRKYSQETRMLRKVADEIQSFLDDDFVRIQETLPWATISGTRRRKASRAKRTQSAAHLPKPGTPSFVARGRAFVRRLLGGEDKPFDGAKALENIRRGGRVQFEINYYRMGKESPRSRYIANRRAIYLNRDHPQLLAAEAEAGVDSVTFKMLSCDIAFTEYALAVVSQLADQGIEVADPIDASEMVQEILDRLGRQAAEKFWSHAQTAALPQPQLEGHVEGNKQNQTRGE
jgi:hypothetical protein